jgi:hypothetical protein
VRVGIPVYGGSCLRVAFMSDRPAQGSVLSTGRQSERLTVRPSDRLTLRPSDRLTLRPSDRLTV